MNAVLPVSGVGAPATDYHHVKASNKRSSVTAQHRHAQSTLWIRQIFILWQMIAAGFSRLQVSHRGMYSIEKLQAFHAYCEKTSVPRALAVCVLTPIPSLLAIVCLECIPLSDPSLGWKANYMFWIRFYISGIIVLIGSTYQVTDMVDCVHISLLQSLRMGIVGMSIYVGTVIAIAYLWGFPVPFGIVLGIGPCFAVFVVVLIFTIGLKTFKANPSLGHELKLQFYVVATEAVIAVIYPAFSSLYLRASPNNRAGLVLLLPLIKLVTKNIVAWASSHVEECIPVVTVFSIEVFNALYVATCMQATKSTLATVVIIVFDVVSGMLAFHSLLRRTRALQEQHQRSQVFDSSGNKLTSEDLIPTVMTASRQLRTFKTKKGKHIRIRSPMKLGLGAEAERDLESLVGHHIAYLTHARQKRSHFGVKHIVGHRGSVSFFSSKNLRVVQPESHYKKPVELAFSDEGQRLELVESTLELLFHTEYHALVEYVECAVPLLFSVYLPILLLLPSHKYYPYTEDMEIGQLESMQKSLSVYIALEVASFVAMHVALKRKFMLSALYQLAFVLETHVVQLQSRMFVWIVFIPQFTLRHFGVDFTFQFAWLHKNESD
ncbi:unnamed protein product [Phytophthora fragariaefolia]|uniref:Unnamed protein product n=1 Tax=Phytophthora fragariaefolia TaxID=1490495 RepID=A0A9W6Y4C3_9STRA|nr:unnamed protein product [Phytophthora fragariaefolia]